MCGECFQARSAFNSKNFILEKGKGTWSEPKSEHPVKQKNP